jgi:hypothetical protein
MTPARARAASGHRLRPLSLAETLDAALKIYRANWRALLRTVLVVVVPAQLVITAADAGYILSSLHVGGSSQTTRQTLEELNRHVGGLAIAALLQLAAIGLATAASLRVIAQDYLGEPPDWRSSLAHARARLGPLLALIALYVIGVGAGTVAFAVPGVWLFVAWGMATPVLLVEGLRGRAALRRSFVLVQGRWWRTFGTLFVGFLFAGVLSTSVQGLFEAGIVQVDGDALVLALSAVAGVVGMLLSTPLQAALLTVVYFDLRVRREGYDLGLLAYELGGAPPEPPVAPDGTRTPEPAPSFTASQPAIRAMPPPPGWAPRVGQRHETDA